MTHLPWWHIQSLIHSPPGHNGECVDNTCRPSPSLTHWTCGTDFCGDMVISTTAGCGEAGTVEATEAVALLGVTCAIEHVFRQDKSTKLQIRLRYGVGRYKTECSLGAIYPTSATSIKTKHSHPYVSTPPRNPPSDLWGFAGDPGLQPLGGHPNHRFIPPHLCYKGIVLSFALFHC